MYIIIVVVITKVATNPKIYSVKWFSFSTWCAIVFNTRRVVFPFDDKMKCCVYQHTQYVIKVKQLLGNSLPKRLGML